jgi:hypothetical protein
MKTYLLPSLAFAAAIALGQTTATAQTAPAFPTKAEKVTGVRYLVIETIEAKPGARLWEIISKHYMPAAKAAGVPNPQVYHVETGVPRTIIISELKGGPGDLEWQYTADDIKWMNALAKQEGGQDKAMALIKEYNDSIARRTRDIVHMHTD